MELERKKAALVRGAYLLMSVAACILAARYAWMLLLPFLAGFLIAYLLRPVVGFISRHSGIGRRGVAIVAAILFYALLGAALWLLAVFAMEWLEQGGRELPRLYRESLRPALEQLGDAAAGLARKFAPSLGSGQLAGAADAALESLAGTASEGIAAMAGRLISSAPQMILTVLFTILSSVMICIDYQPVSRFIMAQVPRRFHTELLGVRDFLAGALLRVLRAYLLLTAVTFGVLAAGLWALGVDRPLSIAAIIALLDLLPVLGSGAVLIPWGIWGLLAGNGWLGGGMLALWAGISIIRQVLEPKIIGDQIGLHPLATLAAMYAGLKLAGFGGLILAPVLCLLLQYLNQKGIVKLWKSQSA